MLSCFVRLVKTFEAERLKSDLMALCRTRGVPAGYPGEGHSGWTSISLFPGSPADPLSETPYFRQVLKELNCTYRLVRLLVLEPGGVIKEHCDSFLSTDVVRLHIPVVTHPDVEAYIGGRKCDWKEGELWYGDYSLPHSAVNRSPITRVHLVLDALVDDVLLGLFPPGEKPASLRARSQSTDERAGGLRRFAFRFTLPAGFHIPGTQYEPLESPLPGSVELIHGELNVCINEQPMLKAVPSSDTTVDLIGLPCAARIHYRYDRESVTLKSAVFTIGSEGPETALAICAQ